MINGKYKGHSKSVGVSTATVSKALNHKSGVSQEVRDQVFEKAKEMGYVVNGLARGMKISKTFTVGVLVSDIKNPFFSEVISAIERILYAKKYNLMICNVGENPQKEVEYLELLVSKKVDGIISSHGSERQNISIYRNFIRHGIKVVFFDRIVENLNTSSVSIDNIEALYDSVRYLKQFGHKKIGAIYGILNTYPGSQRYEGFKKAMIDFGFELHNEWIKPGYFAENSAYKQTVKIMNQKNRPTALIVMNNLMTLGAIKAIKDIGLKIPEDISIVGFDDDEWMRIINPSITTVAQPADAIGMTAATLLLDAMENESIHTLQHVVLKAKLIERESVKNLLS